MSIIGHSPSPLSKYEIEEAFAKKNGKLKQRHVYRMIRSLSGEENYFTQGIQDLLKFLDITLKEKCLERIHELELKYNIKLDYNSENINEGRAKGPWFDLTDEKEEAIREIDSLWSNTENRRYTLNIRGFMLFIYSVNFVSKVHGKKDRIKEVIQNPIIINKLPFLKYWQDFQEVGFDVFRELELLAEEFGRDILDPNIPNYRIMHKIIERYYISITGYFRSFDYGIMLNPNEWHERLKKAVELQIWTKKLKEYSLPLLRMQEESLNEQIASIARECERHLS